MKHQWRRYDEQQDLEDLRIFAADEDDIEVGPFDDCDAFLTIDQLGEQYGVAIMAHQRCDRCGGILLSDPGDDYVAFVGPGDDWRNCQVNE